MKSKFKYLGVIIVCLSILFIYACKTEADVPVYYGDITGTVKDGKTNSLVENAVVSIVSGTETRSITTQTDGVFSFKRIEPGSVQIRVTKDKYELYTQNVKVSSGENSTVTATLQPKIAIFDISPATLDFTGLEVSKVIYVKNATGSGTIGFSAKPNENWMSVSPGTGTVRDNQTVTLTVTVDRKGLAYGNYTGSIVFNADNNSIIYNITMQIPNPNAPSITTNEPTSITQTSAEILGNVTNIGGGSVLQRGHCWSESSNPTILDNRTSLGAGLVGQFSSTINGLSAGKTYYVRAYATNNAGTGYSEVKIFKTSITPTSPAVSIGVVSDITANSAKIAGNVTNIGGANVTEYGHCYGTSSNPTTNDNKTVFGATNVAQAISSTLVNLKQGTKYFVRSYATNSIGTSYSNELFFETGVPVISPSITTGAVSNVGQTSATVNATVTVIGSSPIIQYGFCWSALDAEPTIADSKNQKGFLSSTGLFSSILGLNKGTNYYVRPYVQTQDGKVYYGSSVDVITSENGLLAYLSFNFNANDETTNNNNARTEGDVKLTTDRFNNPNRAYEIKKGKIEFTNPNVGFIGAEQSYCFWLKLDNTNFSGNGREIFGQSFYDCSYYDSERGFGLFIDPALNNKVNFYFNSSTSSNLKYRTNIFEQSSIAGDWHHITIVKKETNFLFYIDGVLVKMITTPYKLLEYSASNYRPLRIGGICSNPLESMIGKIDDVRIYTYALSDSEVANIYKR
jgi:hypothetical protein